MNSDLAAVFEAVKNDGRVMSSLCRVVSACNNPALQSQMLLHNADLIHERDMRALDGLQNLFGMDDDVSFDFTVDSPRAETESDAKIDSKKRKIQHESDDKTAGQKDDTERSGDMIEFLKRGGKVARTLSVYRKEFNDNRCARTALLGMLMTKEGVINHTSVNKLFSRMKGYSAPFFRDTEDNAVEMDAGWWTAVEAVSREHNTPATDTARQQ